MKRSAPDPVEESRRRRERGKHAGFKQVFSVDQFQNLVPKRTLLPEKESGLLSLDLHVLDKNSTNYCVGCGSLGVVM